MTQRQMYDSGTELVRERERKRNRTAVEASAAPNSHSRRIASGRAVRVTILGGAVLVLSLSLSGCTRNGAPAATTDAQQLIIGPENIVVAGTGVVTDGPSISGTLTPALQATVRAQVSGSVVTTNADVGQVVSHGQ